MREFLDLYFEERPYERPKITQQSAMIFFTEHTRSFPKSLIPNSNQRWVKVFPSTQLVYCVSYTLYYYTLHVSAIC
jgi:hypothetical protein